MSLTKLSRVELLHAVQAGMGGPTGTVHAKNIARLEFDDEAQVVIVQVKKDGETVLIPLHGNVKQMVVPADDAAAKNVITAAAAITAAKK